MLEVRGMTAGYGKVSVLRGIDLTVERGACLGVLGRNGMGKTTLLRTVMGELSSWSGTITMRGTPLTGQPAQSRAAAGLGYVPQGKHIFANLSVAENLRMGCIKDFGNADATMAGVLTLFPRLERLLNRPGGALSGGEQQLLALARCLCGKPDLILLDEPTEGIQPSICDEIVDVLTTLKDQSRLSIILVEQDIEFLWALCDRVAAINKGEIVMELNPQDSAAEEQAMTFIGIGE